MWISAKAAQLRGEGVLAKCAGYKGDGTPCERLISASAVLCYSHDTERVQERSRHASKAAKAKGPAGDLAAVKAQLRTIAEDVLEGRLDKGTGSVAAQILGVWARVTEVERRVKEAEELEERLLALEQQSEARRGGVWGV
jgi:hypothetical protein